MTGIGDLTAVQLRDALAGGTLGAVETAEFFLARIEERNPGLGAFVHVAADQALARARSLDALPASAPRGPLHGVPLAVKDLHDAAGMPTTYGSAAVAGPGGDAPVAEAHDDLVAVLEAAGSVLLGKTQVPEFGLNCYSENLVAAPARNPHDPTTGAGGSSGGQAAAVASGMLPLAPGSDGGGSIRIPAAVCGLVGLKPNRGRVATGDAQSDAAQLVVNGPLARTAEDAALLLDVLCSPAPGPAHGNVVRRAVTAAPQASFLEAVRAARRGDPPWGDRPLRIGVSTASPFDSVYEITVSPEARAALDAGIARLRAAGHEVDAAALSYDPAYPQAFFDAWTTSMGTARLDDDQARLLTGLAGAFRERALRRSAVELARAVAVLRRIEQDVVRQYGAWDMVLTPALALPPRPLGWYWEGHDLGDPAGADQDYRRQCQYTPWTSLINVVGLPAVTVPTLWTRAGNGGPVVPMGVQLVGRPSAEAQLLAVAAQLETAHPVQ
ncbi:amidase [Kocuria dechangensis]|uniref:Amidase n=1 Tax=Kocuria dechangensis TaxID=1176249 RepID=A0A917H3A6_9MICC|nr:amidase [Kocuria dechangensis]GGG65625.1 amidase [Kocuria dechangensis]